MPQLDKVTLFSQVFWLIITFVGFYILVTKTFLPSTVMLLKVRASYTFSTGHAKATKSSYVSKFNETSTRIIESYLSSSAITISQFSVSKLNEHTKNLASASGLLKQDIALNNLKRY